jgi:hypothetical protein
VAAPGGFLTRCGVLSSWPAKCSRSQKSLGVQRHPWMTCGHSRGAKHGGAAVLNDGPLSDHAPDRSLSEATYCSRGITQGASVTYRPDSVHRPGEPPMTQTPPSSGWQPASASLPDGELLGLSSSDPRPRGRATLSATTAAARHRRDAVGDSSRPLLRDAARRPHGDPHARHRCMDSGGAPVDSAADGAR